MGTTRLCHTITAACMAVRFFGWRPARSISASSRSCCTMLVGVTFVLMLMLMLIAGCAFAFMSILAVGLILVIPFDFILIRGVGAALWVTRAGSSSGARATASTSCCRDCASWPAATRPLSAASAAAMDALHYFSRLQLIGRHSAQACGAVRMLLRLRSSRWRVRGARRAARMASEERCVKLPRKSKEQCQDSQPRDAGESARTAHEQRTRDSDART